MAARSSRHSEEPTPVAVSEELMAPVSPDMEICYQTFGDPHDDPLLLVMGLSGPMTWWNPDLCTMLAERGFFVIRYDNRDVGRSGRGKGKVTRGMLVRAFLGQPLRPPYSMGDLADDGFGLLDHLGVEAAHVVGISMGGMIAQTMALAHPDRVRSLTSIMSTTGRRTVGWQDPKLFPNLLAPRPADRDAYVAQTVRMWGAIGSPAYPAPVEETEQRAGDTFDRGLSGSGVLRQMLAILTQPNRTTPLHSLRVPTVVIHGDADRMVHVSGGRATATAVPGAELLLVPGMGHDLPRPLFRTVADAIRRNANRAKQPVG